MFVSVVINWLNQFKVMGQIVGYHGGISLGATKEDCISQHRNLVLLKEALVTDALRV